jgi:hypothetical protein
MKTKTIRCQGQCVSCSSENINYDTFQYEGDYGYYPYDCQECGNEGREYFNLIYDVSTTRIKLN